MLNRITTGTALFDDKIVISSFLVLYWWYKQQDHMLCFSLTNSLLGLHLPSQLALFPGSFGPSMLLKCNVI
jgi:hypothetical protein